MHSNSFHLEKYHGPSTKRICPGCGKKTFTRYVDDTGSIVFPDEVGRCDREDKCGYHKTPKQYFNENPSVRDTAALIPHTSRADMVALPVYHYDPDLMQSTFKHYEHNKFANWLASVVGDNEAQRLIQLYYVGTSKHWSGATVFWQLDYDGNVRAGKVMLYDQKSGKRIKVPYNHITWVHALKGRPDGFSIEQCLFGSHLLACRPTSPVCLVESEKTAIICSSFYPECVWLATGGKNGCFNGKACQVLRNRDVTLVPDLRGEDSWRERIPMLTSICRSVEMSTIISSKATPEQKKEDLDIADFLLMEPTQQMVLNDMIARNPHIKTLIDTLDLRLVDEQ